MTTERRRSLRRGLRLPAVVRGHGREGSWEETTSTLNVSQGGLSLTLQRPVPMGQVLLITVPLPELFRRHDLKAQAYNVYALVRYATASGPPYRVGVMFLGKNPPKGFQENRSGLIILSTDPEPAYIDSAHPRHPVMVTLRLRRLEPSADVKEELTVTDEIGLAGARVRTSLDILKGELVFLTEMEGPFAAQAMVLHVAPGDDTITRLDVVYTQGEEAAAAARDLLRRHGVSTE